MFTPSITATPSTLIIGRRAEEIEKQLAYAGHSNAIFSEDALKVIHSFSSGIPRLINRACTQSLVYAYQNRRPIVDDRMVQLVLVGEVS
jgi:type II secretory pathway predicted ATPase ExeA